MRRHYYEIRVVGTLGSSWVKWFDNLSIHQEKDELGDRTFSVLSGWMDQAALHGILLRICDLGVPLIAVNRMDERNS